MYKYTKLKTQLIPAHCSEIQEDGQTYVVSSEPLDLALIYLFDLEPVDKNELDENDRAALDDWNMGRDIKKWWRESPTQEEIEKDTAKWWRDYQQEILNKPPMEIKRELEGEWTLSEK